MDLHQTAEYNGGDTGFQSGLQKGLFSVEHLPACLDPVF